MALLSAGCQPARTTIAASQPAIPAGTNAELMSHISEQPYLTAEAAYHAIYIYWKGEPFKGGFAALTAELAGGRIIGSHWNLPSDARVDRAAVGYMVCRVANIRTGLNWMLTGLGRYAWRELQYRGVAGPGSEWQPISGGEFLGILTRVEEHSHPPPRGETTPPS